MSVPIPKVTPIKISAPPTAGGGGSLDEHGFSPGHHGGAGGREPDAAAAINLSRAGRLGFGKPKGMGTAGC